VSGALNLDLGRRRGIHEEDGDVGRNMLAFSDGAGHADGFISDKMSGSIHKLFRASRFVHLAIAG
jgi:hypothetical protein